MKIRVSEYLFWACVVLLMFILPALVKCQTMTPIQDTIVKADGTRYNGNVTVGWPSFTTPSGQNIPGAQKVITVVNGLFRVSLVPCNCYGVRYDPIQGTSTYEYWTVPASAYPLRIADLHSPAQIITSGTYQQIITTSMSSLTITAAQHGCGPNPVFRVWDTAAGFTDVDATLDLLGTLTLSWSGSFSGFARLSCGAFAPNYSALFFATDTTILIPSSASGITTPNILLQCYDATGAAFAPDYSISSANDVSVTVNPSGATPIAGRCLVGAL